MWIKAATLSFLLADNFKAICFVWQNVRSTAEKEKDREQKLENGGTTALSVNDMKTDGGTEGVTFE